MSAQTDAELAADLAHGAGLLLLEVRAAMSGAELAEVKAAGDSRSNDWLLGRLAETRPDDPVLSEERKDDPATVAARLAASRAWIIDPVDGTREYGEGREDWAVHVALWQRGGPLVGAVALPGAGVTYRTDQPPSVPSAPDRLRVVVSRTRPPAEATAIARAMDADLVEMGSAGAKVMSIIRGEADIYPHSGGQYEWDSCAPVAVALAAGLHASRLDGTPLVYNNEDPYLPDLLVCRPEHAEAAIAAAAAATTAD
jgi:3'(2'), 5'-bisphosphate nucleotidase